jgi:hypothetical protein
MQNNIFAFDREHGRQPLDVNTGLGSRGEFI